MTLSQSGDRLPKPTAHLNAWGPYFIAAVGVLLLAAAILLPESDATRVAAIGFGSGLVAFGPTSPRIKGLLKLNAQGVEMNIESLQMTAQAPGEDTPRVIAEAKAETRATAAAEATTTHPPAHGSRLTVIRLIADAMANGWSAAHTGGTTTVTLTTFYRGETSLAVPALGGVNPGDTVTLCVPVDSLLADAPRDIAAAVEALTPIAKR